MTERSDLCRACGGKCCTNPFFTLSEYIRFVAAIGNEKAQAANPIRINGGWMFRTGRCPGVTDTGCVLEYTNRPLVCRTYPFLPVEVIGTDKHIHKIPLLRVDTCPYWRSFGEDIEDAKKEIENG